MIFLGTPHTYKHVCLCWMDKYTCVYDMCMCVYDMYACVYEGNVHIRTVIFVRNGVSELNLHPLWDYWHFSLH